MHALERVCEGGGGPVEDLEEGLHGVQVRVWHVHLPDFNHGNPKRPNVRLRTCQ